MQKPILIAIVYLFIVSSFFASCSEEEIEPQPKEQETNPVVASLTSHPWKFHSEFYLLNNG